MKKLYFLSAISLFFVIPCTARVIIVDANGTGDYPTIQAAIDDSNDGDIVEVQQGTYTGIGNRDIDFLGKAITVRSINPDDPCVVFSTIIDCQGSAIDPHRGFCFDSNEDANSVLDGFTIRNGYAPVYEIEDPWPTPRYCGGAIFCYNSSPYIARCVLNGNEAAYHGGAISCIGTFPPISEYTLSKPRISECTLSNNIAGFGGGGIYCRESVTTITNCTLSNNQAFEFGGGIYIRDFSHITATNCDFIGNVSRSDWVGGGGGICDWYSSSTSLEDCLFSGNSGKYGGAMASYEEGTHTIIGCTFVGNSSEYGAGLRFHHCNVSINQSLFIANSAADYGGAVAAMYTDMELINSTIYGNSANYYGGGVYVSTDSIGMIRNSIIWNNFAQFGPDVCVRFLDGAPYSSTLSIFFSDIKGGESGVYADPRCTLIWDYDGNIETDPCFADANNDDYHLLPDSPCIDAGDPCYVAEPNETDLDGRARLVDGDCNSTFLCLSW
jgi:parallel beta-helix repeat protein